MSAIDRSRSQSYLVLDSYHYDNSTLICNVVWSRYQSACDKNAGADPMESFVYTWKGVDYPLSSMTTDAEREAFFHSHLQDILPGVIEIYSGTESALVQRETVSKIIDSATTFGQVLLEEFAAENVLLGITQAGMTTIVRQACSEIISALSTGSLYDAITQARAMPETDKDATFLTDARLLAFVNKIENYLGITLSTEL